MSAVRVGQVGPRGTRTAALAVMLVIGVLAMHGGAGAAQAPAQRDSMHTAHSQHPMAMAGHAHVAPSTVEAPGRRYPRPPHDTHVAGACQASLASGVALPSPTTRVHLTTPARAVSPQGLASAADETANAPPEVDLNRLCISRT